MRFLRRVLEFLDLDMEVPEMYGVFHIVFIVLSILAGVILCKVKGDADPRFVRKLLIVTASIVLILEVYKQVNYTFHVDGETIRAEYQWYAFPFQFCSTPMYVSLLAGLIKNKKIHNALCAYLATFALFAGLCVMVYPNDVFIDVIGINIQTMICHGSMISIAIYLLYTGYVKLEHRSILKAIPVFAVCVTVAMIMNEIAYRTGLLESHDFNMFFISPYCPPSLPVYSIVQEVVPFPFCLIIYITAFSIAAYAMLLIAMVVAAGCKRPAAKKAARKAAGMSVL